MDTWRAYLHLGTCVQIFCVWQHEHWSQPRSTTPQGSPVRQQLRGFGIARPTLEVSQPWQPIGRMARARNVCYIKPVQGNCNSHLQHQKSYAENRVLKPAAATLHTLLCKDAPPEWHYCSTALGLILCLLWQGCTRSVTALTQLLSWPLVVTQFTFSAGVRLPASTSNMQDGMKSGFSLFITSL